nr:MAG TPA: hypothetical protein [Caudoviricetes sp.]
MTATREMLVCQRLNAAITIYANNMVLMVRVVKRILIQASTPIVIIVRSR